MAPRIALALACLLLGCNKGPNTDKPSVSSPSAGPASARASASANSNASANSPTAEAPLVPPDASVTELLSGLKAGDHLGTARVVEVFGVNEGRVPIHIASGSSHAWLEISLRSEEPPPPVSTERYSVYWTMRGMISDRMTDEAITEACVRLAERLQSVELQVTPPKALQKFPKPQPVTL